MVFNKGPITLQSMFFANPSLEQFRKVVYACRYFYIKHSEGMKIMLNLFGRRNFLTKCLSWN